MCSYIHMGGKIGVLVSFATEGVDTTAAEFAQCGRDVAMQVAAVDPIATSREDVDPAVVEHEMGIYKAQAAESGKPEAIQEKMATGRLQKFYKEQCLVEQAFVKNPDQTVAEYVDSVASSSVAPSRSPVSSASRLARLPNKPTPLQCRPSGRHFLRRLRAMCET